MTMKTFILSIIVSILVTANLSAQKINEQTVKSDIKSAVLYLTGVEITRSKRLSLKSGQNRIIFQGLSAKINSKSIRVTTDAGVDLLSVSDKTTYLSKKTELPRIKRLKDSLEYINQTIQGLSDKRNAYDTEKSMLLKNLSIGGTDKGVSVTELKQASDFYRSRILDINQRGSEINRKTKLLNKEKANYAKELQELNAESSYRSGEIVVLVSVKSAKTSAIDLKYLVKDGGWSPIYDIKAMDTDKPVELVYRAKVYNNTGVDWVDLKMKLSTADPSLSVTQPDLRPWYMTFKQTYSYNQQRYRKGDGGNVSKEKALNYSNSIVTSSNIELTGKPVVNETGSFSEAVLPELSAEFDIKEKYDIPSNDKPYLVEVTEHKLPAEYKHFAVTKLDKDVFLLARISGWEELNLIDGPANVYYGGTYLGQSFINTRNVKDTLDLSMGRDSKVMVTRSKLKEFSSTQFIGNKRKETLSYEFVAKNSRRSPVTIDVLDQIPISQSDDIEIKVLEISGAVQNETTGELKWTFTLQPGQSRKVKFSYSIKYPKTKTIEIQKKKSRNVRYF